MEPKNPKLASFMHSFNLYNLIKSNTCFKGSGSCIDLILTNRKYCFKHTSTFETGLSDHHHLIYSILKTTFKKEESKKFTLMVKSSRSRTKHAHGDSEIILIEKENIIINKNEVVRKETLLVNNDEITKALNNHFSETVEKLYTFKWPFNEKYENIHNEKLTTIIKKFENHPSIMKIKSKYTIQEMFSVKPVTVKDVENIIKNIPKNKASGGEIPLKILKQSRFTYEMLTDCVNDAIVGENILPDSLKFADITPVHKKDETTNKENYRPVSVLPLISKIFERIIYDQLSEYLEKYLNSILCGFRKAHSTQHALFKLLQAWQEELDNGGFVGTTLIAYDCLPHDLLVAKLEAYGVGKAALNLISNYLSHRKQRTKIGSSYSDWYEIVRGVPQGSILGPLLFNIFINDLFLFIEKANICNFADDNSIYSCTKNLRTVLKNLKHDMINVSKWFKVNSMKANPKKFQFMILGKGTRQTITLNINNIKIRESQNVELLGLIIDNRLTFKDHINMLCRRANYKLHALRRIRKYLTLEKSKLLYDNFINNQFNYASIIWMFCHKQDYVEVEKIHYKALKIVYNSNECYEELLIRNNEVSIHQKQLRTLATEIYKSLTDVNPDFMKSYFPIKEIPYSLRNGSVLKIPPTRSTYYGTNSIHFRTCLLWNKLPKALKESQSLSEFK